MSAPISTMIGIRTGGVLSGAVDMEELKKRITDIIKSMEEEDKFPCDIETENLHYCMSNELVATKGSYVVIAGVFNYWNYDGTSEFGKRLSKEFGVEVMVMTWDEQNDTIRSGIFLAGEAMHCSNENPISRTLRRTI